MALKTEIPTFDDPHFAMLASPRHYGVELTWLWVAKDHRGQGWGELMLYELCAWADATGTRVWTWAKPFRTTARSPYGLAAFYARFGFEPIRPETNPTYYRRVRMRRG